MVQAPNESSSPDEELFQQVPDGWLFTTPILWPVGGRKYVVNDTQKVDLVERLTRWRRRSDRMFSVVLLVIILWQLTRYDWITALSELVGVNSEILGVAIFLCGVRWSRSETDQSRNLDSATFIEVFGRAAGCRKKGVCNGV